MVKTDISGKNKCMCIYVLRFRCMSDSHPYSPVISINERRIYISVKENYTN